MKDNGPAENIYLQLLLEGDENAYRYFIRTYQNMAYTLALSIVKDNFIAQEVSQDAFIKAFKGIKKFDWQSTFKTWFYKIIVNEAFIRLKKIKKEILIFSEEYENNIPDESSLSHLHENEQLEKVNRALLRIPAYESLALRLFYMEDESIKNICTITGWSVSNTKVILHRARKNLLLAIQHSNNNNMKF